MFVGKGLGLVLELRAQTGLKIFDALLASLLIAL
jgi:hypothetical protein